MKSSMFKKYVLFTFIIFTQMVVSAQERITISRIQGELKFDGIVDDACWQNTVPLSMVMHTTAFGNQPTEKSEVMICYDNAYLYRC